MIQDLLIEAISHDRMHKKLNELNGYFYNRKHETQIRDELVVILNQISTLTALSEHPKLGIGAVDISLYNQSILTSEHNGNVATIEIGFAPIFPDTCYHLTHYWPAAADIPVASDNPVHYADAIRYNAR
ncbi:hypothetical protein MP997_13475, partial [Escherichia coli]|nr:hypothetical protein [Escherichia coli]MCI3445078.1 hypothetical protein [Escherichia coli]MDA5360462.1 hypothetical protein [Escherichia coli]MEB6790100.1 hypothetical protein [Escherichia coli]